MTDSPPIRIAHLYVSPGHNFFGHHQQPASTHPMIEQREIACLAGRGIAGDRFLDYKANYRGQITFFAQEIHAQLCAEFGVWDRAPWVFRRNVITAGVDLTTLYEREFEIQGVRFAGSGECAPCYWMDAAFHPGAERRLRGCGGLRAKILTDGVLRVDE